LALLEQVMAQPGPAREQVAPTFIAWLIQAGAHPHARQWLGRLPEAQRQQRPWADLAWSAQAGWWHDWQGPHLQLQRLAAGHAAWLQQLFAQPGFADLVNRDFGQKLRRMPLAQVQQMLATQAQQSAVHLGSLVFAVVRKGPEGDAGTPLGVASLVNIDSRSRRAEFIIGFPEGVATRSECIETGGLMLAVAFRELNLHKVTATVYSDNPRSRSLCEDLLSQGFVNEGTLREHLRSVDGKWLDLHQIGGLAREVMAHPLAQRLMKRYPLRALQGA
jgi:RimJ/RimL family protein N-acetyltransferase